MERSTWTDQRLDDLRSDVQSQGVELRREIQAQGVELRSEIRELGMEIRGEFAALRVTLIRVGGGMMAGLIGVIAAVLARGV